MSLSPPHCLTNWPTHPEHRAAGLAYHGNEHKAAVLLWDAHMIVMHISRRFDWALHGDHPPDKTVSMPLVPDVGAAIDDAAAEDAFRQVLVGAQETCVLTSNGRLLTCEKSQSGLRLQPLGTTSSLGTVQCACVTRDGGLAFVCSSETPVTGALHVYVLPAAMADALVFAEKVRKFDISFEPNELQSTWQTRQMGIKEFTPVADATGRSMRFFQLLCGQSDAECSPSEGYIFLTINNQLLALIVDDSATDDCHMHVVQTFSADICNCWISAAGDALFVLLASGVLEVLHASELLADCGALERSLIFFGDGIVCSRPRDDDVFVYATDVEVVQVKIAWSKSSDQFEVKWRKAVDMYGVIAIEFVGDARQILLLTENGFLYTMPWFCGGDGLINDQSGKLCKVDDSFVARGQRQLAEIVRLTADNQYSHQQIAELKRQYDVLHLLHQHRQCGAETPFRAQLSASKNIPDSVDKYTIYAGSGEQSLLVTHETFFVRITLCMADDDGVLKKWHLSDEKLWKICISESHANSLSTTVRCVRLVAGMFGHQRTVDIVWSTSSPAHLQLPEFKLDLHAFVRNGADFQHLSFAVPCEAIDIAQILRVHSGVEPPFRWSELVFGKQSTANKEASLEYRMRLPVNIDWLDVLTILGSTTTEDVRESTVYIGILERWVRLSVQDGTGDGYRVWCLQSTDAGAMYEIKLRLLTGLQKRFETLAAEWRPKAAVLREIMNMEEHAREMASAESLELLMRKLNDMRQSGGLLIR